ncbi:glycosyltransferase family 8 protein [Rickettsiales bacterium LUAb2]
MNNKINLVLASDQNYVKLLVPCIISILYNKKPTTEYDIYILESGISDFHKQKIKELEKFNNINNCTINFINIKEAFSSLVLNNNKCSQYTSAILYRLAIPQLFKELDKILYLDVDMIIRDDLLNFYNQDFEDNYIASYKKPITLGYKSEITKYQGESLQISEVFLKMGADENILDEEKSNYINSATVLFNISKIILDKKDIEIINKCLEYKDALTFVDQDILVAVFKNKIKNISDLYNFWLFNQDEYNDKLKAYKVEYIKKLNNAIIYHYGQALKPFKLNKLYKITSYKEFYKYYQMSYLKINLVKLQLIFLIASIKRLRRQFSGIKSINGKKVFYIGKLQIKLW